MSLASARTFARLARVEARYNPGVWLAPLVAVTIFWLAHGSVTGGIWLWPDVALALQGAVLVVGPTVGGLSAWQAARTRRWGEEELLASTSRPAPHRDLALWAGTAAWYVLAYVASSSALLALAFFGGAGGPFTLWPVAVGLLAVVACSAAGYAAGQRLPREVTAPVVIAALFVALWFLRDEPSSARHLTTLGGGLTESAFFGILPMVFPEQALWLAGLTGAALAAVVLGRRWTASTVALLAASLAVAALGAFLLLREPPWAGPAQMEAGVRPYEPVCAEGKGLPVCVHPAYEGWLPEAARTVGAVAGPFAGLPGGPERAEQAHNSEVGISPDGTLRFFLHDRASLEHWLALDAAGALVGDDGTGAGPAHDAKLAVKAWLLGRAGADPGEALGFSGSPEKTAAAAESFARLPPEEREAWLRENWADLRTGKVELGELP